MPAGFLGLFGASASVPVSLFLDVSCNPLQVLSAGMFQSIASSQIQNLTINMSYPTVAEPVRFPPKFTFHGEYPTNMVLALIARGMQVDPASLVAFEDFLLPPPPCQVGGVGLCLRTCGPGCNLTLDISDNGLSVLPANAFGSVRITRLVLTLNNLTLLSGNAFTRDFALKELVLSDNPHLGYIPAGLLANAADLEVLIADRSGIRAVPLIARYPLIVSLNENPLECESYAGMAIECECVVLGMVSSKHCGYVRCAQTEAACPQETYFNGSDCSDAPWSNCVNETLLLGQR
jgi:hypothetical protein